MISMIYLMKCFTSMGFAYVMYSVFLSKRKSFIFNRIFLMSAIIGLSIAPFIHLSIPIPLIEESASSRIELTTFWPSIVILYFEGSDIFLIVSGDTKFALRTPSGVT